jgi:large subunit ribosomal protein L13
MKIYNGEDMILGRLATKAAKDLLLGEEVRIVNCEKVIISGKAVTSFQYQKDRRARKGYPLKSNKLPRLADRMVRRAVRGMLPWKQARGKEAFKRIMCHVGVPDELKDNHLTIESASKKKLPNLYYITMEEMCNHLRGK